MPSEWDGNYTCNDDRQLVRFTMNITKSTVSIVFQGNMLISGHNLSMEGSFGSFYKTFAMQSEDAIMEEIASRNFSKVELNGRMLSSIYIQGATIFTISSGKYNCDMEMRRVRGLLNILSTQYTHIIYITM